MTNVPDDVDTPARLESTWCKCGHQWHEHLYRGQPGNEAPRPPCSMLCDCACFSESFTPSWLSIARLAELILRSEATVKISRMEITSGPTGVYGWDIDVDTTSRINLGAPLDAQESYEACEMIAERWMERAKQRRLECASGLAKGDVQAWRVPCLTCGARAAAPCTPTHEGERESGTWTHPARTLAAKTMIERVEHHDAVRSWPRYAFINGDVLAWAERVVAGKTREYLPNRVTMRGDVLWDEMDEEQYASMYSVATAIVTMATSIQSFDAMMKTTQPISTANARNGAVMFEFSGDGRDAIPGNEVERIDHARVRFRRPDRARIGVITDVDIHPSRIIVWVRLVPGIYPLSPGQKA